MKRQTVLVPYDFTEASEWALREAIQVASDRNALVLLLHVLSWDNCMNNSVLHEEAPYLVDWLPRDDAVRDAHERLKAVVSGHPANIEFDTDVVMGTPLQAILNCAKKRDVDLIVAGTHDRGWFSRIFRPSLVDELIHRASCAVLSVRVPNERTPTDKTAA